MNYKDGDIVVCTTDQLYGRIYENLSIGDKYSINDSIEMSEDRVILDVTHVDSKKRIGLFSDKHFMSLVSYRNWKINQLINNKI